MATTRKATTQWQGSLMEGSGQVTLESSGLGTYDVTWASRAEDPNGRTSPEELIAAAHASCYAMAFSGRLARFGTPPERLSVSAEVTSSTNVLGPLANATGGEARRIADASGNLSIPRILAVRSTDTYKGDDWLGLKMRDASVVRGIGVLPMFAGLLGLLLLVGALAAMWAREGR